MSFINYKLTPLCVFDKYKPHFVFHKLVPISSLVWCRGVSKCGSLAIRDARESVLFIGTQFSILYTFVYEELNLCSPVSLITLTNRGVGRYGSLTNRDTRNKSLKPRQVDPLTNSLALVMLFCIRAAGC